MSDRHFDELATRFAEKIYGGAKGAIRLAVLRPTSPRPSRSDLCGSSTSAPGSATCRSGWPLAATA